MNMQTDKTSVASTAANSVDIKRILQMIPHRYPMLMVDKVTEMVLDKSAVGIKNVSINEPFFQGHFPHYAVMPGVLIVEALAQTAGATVMHSMGEARGKRIVYFMAIEKARFRKPVHPGSMLRMPVSSLQRRGQVFRFEGKAFVDDVLCAEAEFSAMIHELTDDETKS
jgi:3-hydroxyacyl-[acyl-carrier-protein] dehydratase